MSWLNDERDKCRGGDAQGQIYSPEPEPVNVGRSNRRLWNALRALPLSRAERLELLEAIEDRVSDMTTEEDY